MSRATFDGTPGTASTSSRVAARNRSAEPKWRRMRRLARRAHPGQGVQHALGHALAAPAAVVAQPEAVGLVADVPAAPAAPAEPSSSSSGSGPPGQEDLLALLGQAHDRHVRPRRPRSSPPCAAASWPLPPSITTRPGRAANEGSSSGFSQPREAPPQGLAHAREVVRAALVAHGERCGSGPWPAPRPRTPPSTRRRRSRPGSRCRSTRSAPAARAGPGAPGGRPARRGAAPRACSWRRRSWSRAKRALRSASSASLRLSPRAGGAHLHPAARAARRAAPPGPAPPGCRAPPPPAAGMARAIA